MHSAVAYGHRCRGPRHRVTPSVDRLFASPSFIILLVTVTRPSSRGVGEPELALNSLRPQVERQPGGRRPAPEQLGLVQAYINTYWDLAGRGGDQLASAAGLADWLTKRGLLEPGTRLDQTQHQRALDLREGLHAMAFVNNGMAADPDVIEGLNRALRAPGLFVQLEPSERPDFQARHRDLESALACIATIVAVAQIDGRWPRLKACPGEHCGWAFYDHSRNQAGSWCSMSVCGSRAKAREYRKRMRRSRSSSPRAVRVQTARSDA